MYRLETAVLALSLIVAATWYSKVEAPANVANECDLLKSANLSQAEQINAIFLADRCLFTAPISHR